MNILSKSPQKMFIAFPLKETIALIFQRKNWYFKCVAGEGHRAFKGKMTETSVSNTGSHSLFLL